MATLSGSSWAILTIHTAWFALLVTEMSRYWGMRKKLKIHARSPMFAMVSGISGCYIQVLIMFYEIFAQEGVTMPCKIMLYSNGTFFATYPVPYILRGVRVIIVSDKAWRAKYSAVLSRKNAFTVMFVSALIMILPAKMLQFFATNRYGPNPTKACYCIAEWWFWWPLCLVLAGASSKLFVELSRVQDRINMSSEIITAALAWALCSVPYFTLDVLDDFGVMKAPRLRTYLMTLVIMITQVSTFMAEPRRSKGKIQICVSNKKKKVVVVLDEPQILAWKQKWHNSRVIMGCPALDDAFEKHVQDYLCSESYDFLKSVDTYIADAETIEAEAQFASFREIINIYIMPGSELEVNIETSMRNKILKIGDHAFFIVAELEARRDIFNPSGTEIRKMLDENLLKTFHTSSIFLNTCKRLEEQQERETSTSTMVDEAQLNAAMLASSHRSDDPEGKQENGDKKLQLSLAQASLQFN